MRAEKSTVSVAIPDSVMLAFRLGVARPDDVPVPKLLRRKRIPPALVKAKREPVTAEHRRATNILRRKRADAKIAGVPFALTHAWLLARISAGVCERTGIPFEFDKGGYHPWNFTIDQREPGTGYTDANCQAVCWAYNAAKSLGTDADVLRMARALVRRWRILG